MSLRRPRPPTPHPSIGEETWVWSALGGMKVLNISMQAGPSSKAAGKRKAEEPPPMLSRKSSSASSLASGDADADIQMIIFNFDGTMTKALPFTRDPQLFKDVSTPGWALSESAEGFQEMTKEEHFTNFGGKEQVEAIRAFFAECMYPVDGDPIKIYIICNGPRVAAKIALKAVGLFETADKDPLVSGILGANDEPFASNPEAGKHIGVEKLARDNKVPRSQILWVATKDPEVQAGEDLGISSIQTKLFEGIDAPVIEQLRQATGFLTPEMEEAAAEEAKGASLFEGLLG